MPDNNNTRQVPPCPGGTLYTIIPGDSYFGLASRFNTTVAAITAANPGVDPQNLRIGQQICIPVATTGRCPGGFLYTIRAGDTYFSIAQRFGTVVPALVAANPGVDPNRLAIGQQICVPAAAPGPGPGPQPTCPGGRLYTIVAGDTLFSLARRFNTTVQAIINANPGIDPNSLQVGRIICIPAAAPGPGPQPTCPGGRLHTIVAGDTLFALAQRFNTTVQAIINANPGIDPNSLQVGRIICIPS